MTTASERLSNNISSFNKNPASVIQQAFDLLEELREGVDIVDPTNPFVYLLGVTAVATSAHINEAKTLTRKQYKKHALTYKELYRHMSDRDHLGVWSKPATTTLRIAVPYDEVLQRAVGNPSTNIRTVRIPRDSRIEVNGLPLGIHYPINIDVLPTGSIQTLYDTSVTSSMQTLNTNIVEHEIVLFNGLRYINMSVPVEQFEISSNIFPLDNLASFTRQLGFEDTFYYARAYLQNTSNQWEEISTTHSIDVYDPLKPTLVIEVLDGSVICYLPDIYTTSGLTGSAIRIDIYTTRGEMSLNLSEFDSSQFSAEWINLDTFSVNTYTAPLQALSQILIYSTEYLRGGRAALSFEQLRDKVVYRVDDNLPLVTNEQIRVAMELYGYSFQKYIDNITDRMYVASKPLPLRTRNGLSTSITALNALCLIGTVNDAPGYTNSLRVNGSRWTITNDALFKDVDGIIRLMPDAIHDAFQDSNNTTQTLISLNEDKYFYTPFHYVLDNTGSVLRVRPYRLDDPAVTYRLFEEQNDDLDYSITTTTPDINLVKVSGSNYHDRYELVITVALPSSVNREEIQLQLKKTRADGTAFYLNASKDDLNLTPQGRIVFRFELITSFDINHNNQIELINFKSQSSSTNSLFVDLESDFSLLFVIDQNINNTYNTSAFENDIVKFTNIGASWNVIGASKEIIRLKLGEYLPYLYAPCRRTIGEPTYARYAADVPAVWPEIVYKPDPLTGFEYQIINDEVVLTVLHEAGDPITDQHGNPTYLHYEGEIMVDSEGSPLIETPASIDMQVGLTLLDAKYRYATTADIIAYRESLSDDMLLYMSNEIKSIGDRLTERTEVYFKPKGVSKDVQVYIGGGLQTTINSELNFNVTFYFTPSGIRSVGLRTQLEREARKVISLYVQKKTVSISKLYDDLKALAGDDLVGLDMDKLGPNKDLSVIQLVDDGASFAIGETIVRLTDGTLDVVDNIEIRFASV